MACKNCVNCCLINTDCFCQFTGLGIELKNHKYAVLYANRMLKKCIGEECLNEICANSEAEDHISNVVKANEEFRLFYSALIELEYMCKRGLGKGGEDGYTQGTGNDYENFSRLSSRAIENKISKQKERIEDYQKDFAEWFKSKGFDCSGEQEESCKPKKCKTCSCDSCTCGQQKSYLSDTDSIAL